jgi:hypothetical protein
LHFAAEEDGGGAHPNRMMIRALPMVLVGVLVGEFGAGAMATGLVLGAAGSKIGGTRRMAYLAPAIGLAGGLGALTAYDWWWVALLATVGVIAGAGIRFGWMPALLMAPYAATFVTPVSTGTDAVIYGAIVAIGTALGVAAAIPVAILSPPAGVLAGVGTVAFVLALTQTKRYWLMYGLYTFSLVLVLATPGHVGYEAEERGVQILVGIGLLVVGLAIVTALARWLRKRYPQPELAPGGPT